MVHIQSITPEHTEKVQNAGVQHCPSDCIAPAIACQKMHMGPVWQAAPTSLCVSRYPDSEERFEIWAKMGKFTKMQLG